MDHQNTYRRTTKVNLVDEFHEQQKHDTRLTMADFCRRREICVRTFRIWVKNYVELSKSKHDNRKKKRTVWKRSLEEESTSSNNNSSVIEVKIPKLLIKPKREAIQNEEVVSKIEQTNKLSASSVSSVLPELNPKDINLPIT